MKATFGEWFAAVYSLAVLAAVFALLVMTEPVPNELWAALPWGVIYILGSRTSKPEAA